MWQLPASLNVWRSSTRGGTVLIHTPSLFWTGNMQIIMYKFSDFDHKNVKILLKNFFYRTDKQKYRFSVISFSADIIYHDDSWGSLLWRHIIVHVLE